MITRGNQLLYYRPTTHNGAHSALEIVVPMLGFGLDFVWETGMIYIIVTCYVQSNFLTIIAQAAKMVTIVKIESRIVIELLFTLQINLGIKHAKKIEKPNTKSGP